MSYKLRPGFPDITITDGECKGQKFQRGKVYTIIPSAYKDRFEATETTTTGAETKAKTKSVEDKTK